MQKKIDDNLPIAEEALYKVSDVDGSRYLRFFDDSSLLNLSLVSKTMRYATIEEVNNRAQLLVQHVVYGEEEEAEAMIKACPELLYYRVEVVDYSGRTIIATAFQAALGAEDICMCTMILKYIDKEVAFEQFNEQFPNGLEVAYDFNAETVYDFTPIINAMINNSDNLEELIAELRVSMTANNEIKSGLHFNMQHLIAAYNAYVENWDALKNSETNYKNCEKFWVEIIGFIQRQMPANYAQAYCSGLKSLEDNPKNFKRTLSLSNPSNYEGGVSFFPLLDASGIGFDFAIYSYYSLARWLAAVRHVAVVRASPPSPLSRKLCETKSNGLAELRDSLEQEPGHHPEV